MSLASLEPTAAIATATDIVAETAALEPSTNSSMLIDSKLDGRKARLYDSMVDFYVSNPFATLADVSRYIGHSVTWVSRIVNTDAFRAKLAAKKVESIDPMIRANLNEKLILVAQEAAKQVLEKLEKGDNPDFALQALQATAKVLALGGKKPDSDTPPFALIIPAKVETVDAWQAQFAKPDIEGEIVPATTVH